MNFPVFDLHCDTIGECSNNNFSLKENNLHIDLQRAKEIEEYTQVFAIWIPDELRGKRAVEYFDKVADCFYKEVEENNDLISLYADNKKTPVKALLSVEGGSANGGTIEGLHHLYERAAKHSAPLLALLRRKPYKRRIQMNIAAM